MKYIFFILGLIWFGQPIFLFGQELVRVENYDNNWNKINSDKSYYQRNIYKENDSLYLIKDYVKNKYLEMEGFAISIDPIVEQGEFKRYNKQEKILSNYFYKDGELIWCNYTYKGIIKYLNYDFKTEIDTSNKIDINNLVPIITMDEIFKTVDKMPSFEDGDINKFRFYVATNLHYPYLAYKYNKTGKIYVSFIINEEGKVTNVKIVEPQYKDLNKEAIRVISESPNWTPGYDNGKPVKVKITYPVIFVLY